MGEWMDGWDFIFLMNFDIMYKRGCFVVTLPALKGMMCRMYVRAGDETMYGMCRPKEGERRIK